MPATSLETPLGGAPRRAVEAWPDAPLAGASRFRHASPFHRSSATSSEMVLDLVEKHAKIRAKAEWDSRLRREEWVRDYRQVLHGMQAPSAKAYAEIAAGWHPTIGPDKKELDEAQLASREELKQARSCSRRTRGACKRS